MPTTTYAVTVNPPVNAGFYRTVDVRFEHAAAPAAEPNPNPAYATLNGTVAIQGRTRVAEPATFYFAAGSAVRVRAWVDGDDLAAETVTPGATASPAIVTLLPSSSGTPTADLSSRYASVVAVPAPTGIRATDEANVNGTIAAAPVGALVWFQLGTYVGRFAVARNDIALDGPPGAVLQLPALNTYAQPLTIAADRVTVRGITIDGNKANQTFPNAALARECDGIGIYGDDVTIDGVTVKNAASHGIIAWNEATSAHNGAPNATRSAGERTNIKILNCTVIDNGIDGNGRSAIDIATSINNDGSIIAWNTIYGDAGRTSSGITLHSASRGVIHANVMWLGNCQRGITCHTGSIGARITDNIILVRAGQDGVERVIDNTNGNDAYVAGNYAETNRSTAAFYGPGTVGSATGQILAFNTVRFTQPSSRFLYIDDDVTVPGLYLIGNRQRGATNVVVAETPARAALARVVDHYVNDVLVESTRTWESDDLPWTIYLSPYQGVATQTGWNTIAVDTAAVTNARLDSVSTVGSVIGWDVTLSAGTWSLEVMHVSGTNRGIADVQIDGVSVGTIDFYAATAARNVVGTLAGITVATGGRKRVTLNMLTRNVSSAGFAGALQMVALRRTA